jgi:hypothetical protein
MQKYYIIKIIQPKYKPCGLKFDLISDVDVVSDIIDGKHIIKTFFYYKEAEDYILQWKYSNMIFAIKEVFSVIGK